MNTGSKKVKFIHSLNVRGFLVLLLALLTALPVYFGARAFGNFFVEKYYMSPEAASARRVAVYNSLRIYVQSNQLSSRDSAQLGAWAMSQPYVSISVHTEFTRIDAGRWGLSVNSLTPEERNRAPTAGEGIYYMPFTDGIYQVTISESSQSRQYALCTFVSVLLACLSVILIMLIYVHRITLRVISLADCAYEIGCGDLNREIYAHGRDELALLGYEMDGMRRSIIERMDSERAAWQANSSLITAISHDLRTPMTAMIGYLELLEGGECADGQRERFIRSAHAKAMELKELTDELFKYFLVFGSSEIALEPEAYDAGILLDQLIGESAIELSDAGFDVHSIKFEGQCRIHVDALHLKRVFDNLLSNVRKYADIKKPVVILSEKTGTGRLSICVSNSIDKKRSTVESSKIGLQTCARIVSQLGGVFKSGSDGEHFVAEVILPIVKE